MRKILGIILACILSVIVIVHAEKVNAQTEVFFDHPITNPITSPITAPLLITGKVTYHTLGRIFAEFFRKIPAVGVTITVTDFFHHSFVMSTTTDKNGQYSVTIPSTGLYKVTPSDTSNTFFAPSSKVVPVNNITKHATADFQGFKFF